MTNPPVFVARPQRYITSARLHKMCNTQTLANMQINMTKGGSQGD